MRRAEGKKGREEDLSWDRISPVYHPLVFFYTVGGPLQKIIQHMTVQKDVCEAFSEFEHEPEIE